MSATKKKQAMRRTKKPHADVVTITADEMRSELLSAALAWYVRRAQRLGADPMPLLSWGLQDNGGRFDSFLSSREWTDEKAAGLLRYYGLIPRRRKSGPKERFSKRVNRERLLRNFDYYLRQAKEIQRDTPRKLTSADDIARARYRPDLPRELYGIVAEYRKKKRGAHALAGLVAAFVLRGDPETAVARLDALRHAEARRTNSRRESVARNFSTLAGISAPKGNADEPPPDDGSGGNPEASAANTSRPSLKGRRSSFRPPVDEQDRLRRGGSPGVDRVPKAEKHRRPRPRPGRVRKKPPP
jgi:hypothetical protein